MRWRPLRETSFGRAPRPLRALVLVILAAALVATTLAAVEVGEVRSADLLVAAVLVAAAAADVEFGRLAEGGRTGRNRPHKGLSAWPFAAGLLLPAVYAAAVLLPIYTWARRRGIRIRLWKWAVSGAAVVLAALAADVTHTLLQGGAGPLVGTGRGLLAVAGAAAVFVAVEGSLILSVVTLNPAPEDELFRRILRSPVFYLTEYAVLATGAVTAALVRFSPWYVLAALPGFALVQRAVLHAPLRDEARTDAKTGVTAYRHWRQLAEQELLRARAGGTPVTVVLGDLDHFKLVNDRHGHLVGDQVLREAADALCAEVRDRDLVGRFGGEEFCLLLPQVDEDTAPAVAERLRRRVGSVRVNGDEHLSISVGVCVLPPHTDLPLQEAISLADHALYDAKEAGRNRVCLRVAAPSSGR